MNCARLLVESLATVLDPDKQASVSFREYVTKISESFGWANGPDVWQLQLADIMEHQFLKDPEYRRLKVHGPPRVGKSVICTVMFLAWYIGTHPDARIGLVMGTYHDGAEKYAAAVRDLIMSDAHKEIFPDPRGWLIGVQPRNQWATPARRSRGDSAPSMSAFGIDGQYTGKGFDVLIIDDPYRSINDADSPVINGRTVEFLRSDVMTRATKHMKIMIMNHDFHNEDLGAVAVREFEFKRVSFPMFAEEENEFDPTDRQPGEMLCKNNDAWLESDLRALEAKNPRLFRSLFQGHADSAEGTLFQASWFEERITNPRPLQTMARAYDVCLKDTASSDYTASALGGIDSRGVFQIREVTEDRIAIEDLPSFILMNAMRDPVGTIIAIEESNITLSLINTMRNMQAFRGYTIIGINKGSKDKHLHSLPWKQKARHGLVALCDGPIVHYPAGYDKPTTSRPSWVVGFLARLVKFDNTDGNVDDVVDAVSILHDALVQYPSGDNEVEYMPNLPHHTIRAELEREIAYSKQSTRVAATRI